MSPDRVVAWLGGPSGTARDGGLAVRYRPPAGFDMAAFEALLAWFAPYAAIDVVVPVAAVDDARREIAALCQDLAVEAVD